jgi:hypothetical protein
MKKVILALLAILLLAVTFAGCGKDNTADTTAAQTTEATTVVETTQEETTVTAVPIMSEEQILALSASDYLEYVSLVSAEELSGSEKVRLTAVQFLNYIKNKKVDDIARFMNGPDMTLEPGSKFIANEAFNVFEKIDVDSFEVHLSNNGRVSEYVDARVVLKISKSNSTLFPVGTSQWILRILKDKHIYPECKPIGLFRNVNDSSIIISYGEYLGHAVSFCYRCSTWLGCFETMDDFDELHISDELVNLLIRNRDGFLLGVSEDSWVSRTDMEALAKNTFGITKFDFKKINAYDSKKDAINMSDDSNMYPFTTQHYPNQLLTGPPVYARL